jgi:hypothetical protein
MLNAAHLALCLLVRGAIALKFGGAALFEAFSALADLSLWTAFSAACSLGRNDSDPNGGASFALAALSPALLLAIAAYALQNAGQSWAALAFVGAPINFYMRPLAVACRFLPANAYLVYIACATALILACIFGYAYGARMNRKSSAEA